MDKSKVEVFLDNGHGVDTAGKRSPLFTAEMKKEFGIDRLYEYKYTREVVKDIEKELKALGISVYIVTPEERDIALATRVKRINNRYATLKKQGKKAFLISVHLDAAGMGKEWMSATGWSSYTTKGQNISDILSACMYEAAHEVLDPLKKRIRTDKTDKDEDKEANYYILKKSNVACTLSENFFQDCKDDIRFLLSKEGKKAIVDIHVKGILKYIAKL